MEARGALDAEWIEMQIKGLMMDPGNEVPVVVLRSVGGQLLLPIWIGPVEANAIAMAVEGIQPPRPMTHDLLRGVVRALDATLERVEIWKLLEGTFHARLRLRQGDRVVEVDSRPSDAIALALRLQAPVWVARTVLENAISAELEGEQDEDERVRQWLENVRPEELGKYKM